MTQEEKQLLLKDLCSRLPYGVKCKLSAKGADISITEKLETGGLEHFIFGTMDVKPYLRPLSSMTYEERQDARERFFNGSDHYDIDNIGEIYADTYQPYTTVYTLSFARLSGYIDWLIAHHFDYRGLIDKELAIEAPENMYKF